METEQKKRRQGERGKDKKPRRRTEASIKAKRANIQKARAANPLLQGIEQANNLPEEYNANAITFIMAITPTEPLDYNDVEEMQKRFNRYLELCAQYGKKVSNQAAYLAIGVNSDLVAKWTTQDAGNAARYGFFKKVKQICGVYREGLMSDGKINPVTGIFWQKNYDGLKDQQDVVVTPQAAETVSAEEIREKYIGEQTPAAIEQKDENSDLS